MVKFRKGQKGFTLIELMIVVAIIGVLAAVAIPRFADLIRRGKEGAAQGNLGALRSAISIYYGDTTFMPDTLTRMTTKYIQNIPPDRAGNSQAAGAVNSGGNTSGGSWVYTSATGVLSIGGAGTDTKGGNVSDW